MSGSNKKYTAVTGPITIVLAMLAAQPVFGTELPGPDQAKIEAFLVGKGYEGKGWNTPNKDGRPSGVVKADGTSYTYHGFMKVFYSAGVKKWLDATPSRKPRGLESNDMIVALEYAPNAEGKAGELLRINAMVRWKGGQEKHEPYDGWFWSVSKVKPGSGPDDLNILSSGSSGVFGSGRCISCHAAANNESMVFLGSGPPDNKWTPGANDLLQRENPVPAKRTLIKPLTAGDKKFLDYFKVKPATTLDFEHFPAKKNDHVYAHHHAVELKKHQQFVTSDQCLGCHNASRLIPGTWPNMLYPEPEPAKNLINHVDPQYTAVDRNFSPYGEWSASLNGLSGRDPVWHAQVAFERDLRPELAEFTDGACFSCHGPMATRQLSTDLTGEGFRIDMFYATGESKYAKYGALARDGVSCAVCHQISAKNLGTDPAFDPKYPPGKHLTPDQLKSYTASFTVEPYAAKNAYWGPYEAGRLTKSKVSSLVMDKSLGQRARFGPLNENGKLQIHESKLCGSCHTVIVPALPVGYEIPKNERGDKKYRDPFHDPEVPLSFEQTTYFEWRNSQFENEVRTSNPSAITCQGCHMAYHTKAMMKDGKSQRIVNTLSNRYPPIDNRTQDPAITYTEKDPIYRHVLLGINYFVFEMYEQFRDLLVGTQADDPRVPEESLDPMINARDWIENHAKKITAEVRITDIDQNKVVDGKEYLEVEVEVTNFAGHKFPTGAGFRRAFLKFEVFDNAGNVLWASGRFDELGVLLDRNREALESEETHTPHKSQPHHQIITHEDQVQIYETRALDSNVRLQTTVLGIFCEYKDNRILPLGFKSLEAIPGGKGKDKPWKNFYAMAPRLVGQTKNQPKGVRHGPTDLGYDAPKESHEFEHNPDCEKAKEDADEKESEPSYEVVYDADYFENSARGQDHIRYRVPKGKAENWVKVRAQLYYQTIPPYYLRDRFAALDHEDKMTKRNRSDLKRLVYMTSHLNLKKQDESYNPVDNWSLMIGDAAEIEKTKDENGNDVAIPDEHLGPIDVTKRLKRHYTYLNLP